jgi:prephenate dehydrogenase
VITGWDVSRDVLQEAISRGIIDEVDEALGTGNVSASDLVYLAMPVSSIIKFLRNCGSSIKQGAVVTDAGSTKREICEAASLSLPPDCLFVGGHPVAGSHLFGLTHARADLFTGQPYVLVIDDPDRSLEPVRAFQETIAELGSRIVLMDAEEHDRAMAYVSHLPQLLSSALAATVNSQADSNGLLNVAGSGYADMTRLAQSNWLMWHDILVTNRDQISPALGQIIACLQLVREEIVLRPDNRFRVTKTLFEKKSSKDRIGTS